MQKKIIAIRTIVGKSTSSWNICFITIESFISILGWALLTVVFAYVSRRFAGAELNEVADFAANSLLIQDAKHLHLLVGHYSRVGFNHPGPFILYVLAAGEWLLFDCLHLVKSPLAGQVFAVSAFNAWWLVLIGRLLFRMMGSLSAALASWFVFLTIAVYFDHNFINGLWFPHLFFWPFATYCLALTRLAAGKSDSLITLALSGGTLVHGHVSFIAICGIMFAGTIVLNWQQRNDDNHSPIISRNFFRINRRALVLPAIICLLFLAPLVAETIKSFPGPIEKYAEFSSGNARNSFGSALNFIAQYWGFGLVPLGIGILLTCFLIAYHKDNRALRTSGFLAIQKSVPVLLIVTAAMLFYVIVGVDDLSMPYLGLFYFSIPAITLALITGLTFLSTRPSIQWFSVFVLACLVVPFIYRQAALSPDYVAQYENPNIPSYFNKLASLDTQMLALDLDNHEGWKDLWSTLLGIEVYAARHGHPDLFCVNKHWQIAFMEKARCSSRQLRASQRLIVSTAPQAAGIFGEPLVTLGNIRFYKFQPLHIFSQRMVEVANNKTLFTVSLLQDGWSAVSEDFAWSEGKFASLVFDLGSVHHISAIDLDIAAFLPRASSTQTVGVDINGVAVDTLHFTQANNRSVRKLILPVELQESTTMTVELHIESPTSPKQAGISVDPRLLGVALYGVEFEGNAVR